MKRDKLAKQNILVTGGNGFAGRYAIKRLIGEGNRVFAIVRDKKKLLKALGENIELDLLDVVASENPEKTSVEDLRHFIEDNNISSVVHIAGIVGEHKISWDRYFEVNVLWTKKLAQAFLQANVNRGKFIFTSSVGVYGTIPKQVPADEDAPYNPDGRYHKSKVLAEKALLELQSNSDLPLIILRPTILYGNEDRGFLFKLFKLMRKKIFPLCGSNPCIHLLDVELLAEVYVQLIDMNGVPSCRIFNVADAEPIELRGLARYITNSMDAGYLKIPSFVFSFLTKLFAFNHQYTVSLKLISKNWFYNVDRLHINFNFKKSATFESLDKKYIAWYKGVGDIG